MGRKVIPLRRHNFHCFSLMIPPFPTTHTDYFMILSAPTFCVLVARRVAFFHLSFMNISCRKLNALFLRTRSNVMWTRSEWNYRRYRTCSSDQTNHKMYTNCATRIIFRRFHCVNSLSMFQKMGTVLQANCTAVQWLIRFRRSLFPSIADINWLPWDLRSLASRIFSGSFLTKLRHKFSRKRFSQMLNSDFSMNVRLSHASRGTDARHRR